jgi:hypothetical protein
MEQWRLKLFPPEFDFQEKYITILNMLLTRSAGEFKLSNSATQQLSNSATQQLRA